jgi:two-component system KDP operon response regulator KdpE
MSEKKIMIVDDDRHLVLGLTARLKANGYKVISATDAISAITVARRETPDLMILDLGLPGGDGFMVLQRMQDLADLTAIPVIVLSARNPTDNRKRALDACAVAYFQKPPDNYEFLGAVRKALGETSGLSTFLAT